MPAVQQWLLKSSIILQILSIKFNTLQLWFLEENYQCSDHFYFPVVLNCPTLWPMNIVQSHDHNSTFPKTGKYLIWLAFHLRQVLISVNSNIKVCQQPKRLCLPGLSKQQVIFLMSSETQATQPKCWSQILAMQYHHFFLSLKSKRVCK